MNHPNPAAGSPDPSAPGAGPNDADFPFDLFDEPYFGPLPRFPGSAPGTPPPAAPRVPLGKNAPVSPPPNGGGADLAPIQQAPFHPPIPETTEYSPATEPASPPPLRPEPPPWREKKKSAAARFASCVLVLGVFAALFGGGAFAALYALNLIPGLPRLGNTTTADATPSATERPVPTPSTRPDPTIPEPSKESLVVNSTDGPYRTIAAALAKAGPKAEILIQPGTYDETLTITREVQLTGEGKAAEVIIRGSGKPCLTMRGPCLCRHLTFQTDDPFPAVLVAAGTAAFDDCTFTSKFGPCVRAAGTDARPSFDTCRMKGGAFGLTAAEGAAVTLDNCTLEGNKTGVLFDQAGGRLSDCRIEQAENRGVDIRGGRVELSECKIMETREGPGLETGAGGEAVLNRCTLRKNDLTGVRALERGKITLIDCKVSEHTFSWVIVQSGGVVDAGRCKKTDVFGNTDIESEGKYIPPQ